MIYCSDILHHVFCFRLKLCQLHNTLTITLLSIFQVMYRSKMLQQVCGFVESDSSWNSYTSL